MNMIFRGIGVNVIIIIIIYIISGVFIWSCV